MIFGHKKYKSRGKELDLMENKAQLKWIMKSILK